MELNSRIPQDAVGRAVPLEISHVSVVDAAAGTTHHDRFVTVVNGRIAAIREQAGPAPRRLNARELFLAPGLIDGHVHLFLDGGRSPRENYLRASDDEKMSVAVSNAARALDAGITTMRDCGSPAHLMFEFQRRSRRGEVAAPEILSCGCPLTRPGGHCHFMGGEVATRQQVRQLIERQLSEGAHFVKVMASGGGLTPGTNPAVADFHIELMREAAEVAHSNGVQIAAHCHATESIVRAIEAEFDIIEHHSCVDADGRYRFEEELAMRTRDQGVIVSPTVFGALRSAQGIRESGRPQNPEDIDALARLEGRLTNTTHFHRLGVRMLGGTDCGVPNTPFDSLVDELTCYVRAGLSPAEALRSVTSESAHYLRLPNVGEVKPGYRADLLLLAGDPLADIETLRHPLAVLLAGSVVRMAESLRPKVSAVEALAN